MASVRALQIGDRVAHPRDLETSRTLTRNGWEPPIWLATVAESPIPIPEGKVCVVSDAQPDVLCFFYPTDLRRVEETGNQVTVYMEEPRG